jgi:hypothetical protein
MKPPGQTTLSSSGFAGFGAGKPSEPSKDAVTQPLQSSGFSAFNLGKTSESATPAPSTAATSLSGDSTETTPGPVKKDFASGSGFFPGITPSASPAPSDKDGEQKGQKDSSNNGGFSGFGAPSTSTTSGFGFGGKPEISDGKKDDDKQKAFAGFGKTNADTGVLNLVSTNFSDRQTRRKACDTLN